MTRILYIIFTVLNLLTIGCETKTEWDLKSDGLKYPVFESRITNELKHQTIKISYSQNELNASEVPVHGAVVVVNKENASYNFSETSPGVYVSDEKFQAVIGTFFIMHATIEGEQYTAVDYALPVAAVNPLNIAPAGDSTLLVINEQKISFSENDISIRKVFIDWSQLPSSSDPSETESSALQYFYSLNTVDLNELFPPNSENVFFPEGSRLYIRKYSMSAPYAKFMRAVLIETGGSGGYFDQAAANISGNINNNGKGFFAVCSVDQDSLVAEVN